MTGSQEGKSLQLDHRHLAFFFLAAVGVCAVFFALGYTVGRAHSQTPAAKEPWAEKNPGGTTSRLWILSDLTNHL